MALICGIVGLPNAGKSTLFNVLIGNIVALAANFPFCTIEPNVGMATVPDKRLSELATINNSEKIIPATITFMDIAGIIEGASQGQGLGNAFLGHIREVDVIAYVVRCFEDEDVIHVNNRVDPLYDLETLETELMLADLKSCETRLSKKVKKDDKEALKTQTLLELAYASLKEGKPARDALTQAHLDSEDEKLWANLGLLTQKKSIVVCNVDANSVAHGNALSQKVETFLRNRDPNALCLCVCAQLEQELLSFTPEERTQYLQTLDVEETTLQTFMRATFQLLGLSTFFTCGPKETRGWPFPKGMLAPACAGIIHSDLKRGFICAEVTAYADYIAMGGEKGAKESGKLRLEGKEYVMQDGDVVHFRFNV